MSPGQALVLRLADSTDAVQLAKVHLQAWQSAYEGLLSASYLSALESDLERRESVLRDAIVQQTLSVWVAQQGDRVVGWASFGPSRDADAGCATAELRAINLLPEVWSQGIGRRLWRVIADHLMCESYTHVTAWVLQGNERAIGFYQAVGFVHEPGSEQTVVERGEPLALLRYRTQLVPALVQTPLITPRLRVVPPDASLAQPLLIGDCQSTAFGVCDTLLFKWPVVRPARLDDADQIAQVHVRSWQQAYSQLMPQAYLTGLDQTLSQRRAHWAEAIARGSSQVRVVSLEGTLIGWVSFGPSRDTDVGAGRVGEVMALYVLAEHWGHGVGRRLWQAARAWLGKQGYERITLWVLVENTRAIRFYQACGWVEEPQTRRTLQRGGVTLEEVRYSGFFPTRRGE